jgi:hypothetical protein
MRRGGRHVCSLCEWNGCGRRRRRNPTAPGSKREVHGARQARGRPLPWAAQGGGVSKRNVPRSGGFAAIPSGEVDRARRASSPTAIWLQPGQGGSHVVATRRKTRTVVGSRRRFMGNHEAERVTRETERSLAVAGLIVPNGREARHSHREAGPQSSAFPVFGACFGPANTSLPRLRHV